MIKTETKDGVIHIYSTKKNGKVRQKDTGLVFNEAYEPVDGKHHEYEEVE